MKTRMAFTIATVLTAVLVTLAHGKPTAALGTMAGPVPRFECDSPGALRLRRFEDGSAQLRCHGRLLARVSSPG